jgi:large subunit ribosomal protein L10
MSSSSVQEQKQAVVQQLAAKMSGANSLFLTDFSGLSVKSITELRARLRQTGTEYLVVKNTLAERALQGTDLPDIGEHFRGPTAMAIELKDPVAAAKVLADFAKEHDNRPALKVGVVERKAVTAAEIVRLAQLPPREQLLAELAGAFEAPMAQLVSVMQAKMQELVGLFDALRAERGE